MPRWPEARYLKLVRLSAAYDLVVTLPFATPWTLAWVHAGLQQLAAATGLAPLPALDPLHVLFANLLGIVVSVWALVRLQAPSRRLGRWDAAARWGFGAAQLHGLALGLTPLLMVFTVFEFAFGLAQSWPVADDAAPAASGSRLSAEHA